MEIYASILIPNKKREWSSKSSKWKKGEERQGVIILIIGVFWIFIFSSRSIFLWGILGASSWSLIIQFIYFYSLFMIAAILKRPRTPPTNNSAMDYQTADSEHVLKRSRPFGISDEVVLVNFSILLYFIIVQVMESVSWPFISLYNCSGVYKLCHD